MSETDGTEYKTFPCKSCGADVLVAGVTCGPCTASSKPEPTLAVSERETWALIEERLRELADDVRQRNANFVCSTSSRIGELADFCRKTFARG